ncbi:hypothetical protein [Salipaludibacillus aurantiacus]|uniref:Uncharacterized protein n=1 Tax=Salipaludibacillus aurantiacus TaxID=1601833 RepID=A0A1H9UL71_9BACI|nr:hypothetical protein [Salipaludibacillus aurantiacus]SES09877.1 hypothetical protein SAMN05518684_1082 [Salipaludibacillus aurantiacus]
MIPYDDLAKKINVEKIKITATIEPQEVKEVAPINIINHKRFDIMAKYIYAWYRENNIKSDWGLRLYDEHLRVFNNYEEGVGSEKKGIDMFLSSFHSTLDSIKKNGFDDSKTLIPVGTNNVPIDGAHRLTAALLYNKNVKTVKLEHSEVNYSYNFFVNRGLDALQSKWCDAITYEYCKMKKNTRILILFPSVASKKNEVKQILDLLGGIYYKKNIFVGNEGPRNLMFLLYRNTYNIDHPYFKQIDDKIKINFKTSGSVQMVVFEKENVDNLKKAKLKLQKLSKGDSEAFFLTDDHNQTIELSQVLLNYNSMHFLNNAKPYKNQSFVKSLDFFKKSLEEKSINKEYICLGNSSVLAAYGIKETFELDFVQHDSLSNLKEATNIVTKKRNYNQGKDDLIFNPENHFYFNGIKFVSISLVKKMKRNSKSPREIKELSAIQIYLLRGNLPFKVKVMFNSYMDLSKSLLKRIRKAVYLT